MQSYLVEYIQNHPNDWKELLAVKDISIKNQDNLYIFNYNITANFSDPIVREARGIILHIDDQLIYPVCWAFNKFGNYGEPYADKIDWSTARVQEKIDGSLIKVWWYKGEWHISTNSTIDAFNTPMGVNFGQLFERAIDLDYSRLNPLNTYMFELVSPENRVVIDYNNTTVYHIGTRNKVSGEEIVEDIGIQKPKEYSLHSLEDCVNAANQLNPIGQAVIHEGFVVVDKNWHRIKVKSPEYVAIHHLLPNGIITDAQIIDMMKANIIDDIVTYVPSAIPRIDEMKESLVRTKQEIQNYISENAALINTNHLSRADWAKVHNKDKYFSFAVKRIFDNKDIPLMSLSTEKILRLL